MMTPEQTKRVDTLPAWFLRYSELSMDPLKGPDEQYRAGALDMLNVILSYGHRVGPTEAGLTADEWEDLGERIGLHKRALRAEAAARDFAKVLSTFAAASTSTRPGHEHIAVFVAHEDEAALSDVLARHPDYGSEERMNG